MLCSLYQLNVRGKVVFSNGKATFLKLIFYKVQLPCADKQYFTVMISKYTFLYLEKTMVSALAIPFKKVTCY